MSPAEIVAIVLIAALAIFVVFAAVVGLLGVVGAVRFVRCTECGRLGLSSPAVPLRSCVYCRHGWILHPMYELHHTHAPNLHLPHVHLHLRLHGQAARPKDL